MLDGDPVVADDVAKGRKRPDSVSFRTAIFVFHSSLAIPSPASVNGGGNRRDHAMSRQLNTTALHGRSPHQARVEFIPSIVGLALLGFAMFYTIHFAVDEFDYRVIGSRLVCAQPLNNRCVTHYAIQNAGAQSPSDYMFYGYQFADGDLHAGNEVRKVGTGFAYSVNGRVKTWSHGSEMSLWAAGALVLFLISYCWHRILR